MKLLSIIIVTYNSEKDIYDCVSSISQNSDILKSDLELIIVDNCSNNTETMFANLQKLWGEDIVCISNSRNGGYGQGNNLGIKQATAPICLIMNPDVRLIKPIFKQALHHFSRRENLGILGLKQYLDNLKTSKNSISFTWLINGYLRAFLNALCSRLDYYIPQYMYVQGSCFFIRKSFFKEVGMFDEENFMYGEEEDIHFRLKSKYGPSCMGYDKSLPYIHKTLFREPSLDYLKKVVKSNINMYQKKGFDKNDILVHFEQNVRLLRMREVLKRTTDSQRYTVLTQFLDFLLKEKGTRQ